MYPEANETIIHDLSLFLASTNASSDSMIRQYSNSGSDNHYSALSSPPATSSTQTILHSLNNDTVFYSDNDDHYSALSSPPATSSAQTIHHNLNNDTVFYIDSDDESNGSAPITEPAISVNGKNDVLDNSVQDGVVAENTVDDSQGKSFMLSTCWNSNADIELLDADHVTDDVEATLWNDHLTVVTTRRHAPKEEVVKQTGELDESIGNNTSTTDSSSGDSTELPQDTDTDTSLSVVHTDDTTKNDVKEKLASSVEHNVPATSPESVEFPIHLYRHFVDHPIGPFPAVTMVPTRARSIHRMPIPDVEEQPCLAPEDVDSFYEYVYKRPNSVLGTMPIEPHSNVYVEQPDLSPSDAALEAAFNDPDNYFDGSDFNIIDLIDSHPNESELEKSGASLAEQSPGTIVDSISKDELVSTNEQHVVVENEVIVPQIPTQSSPASSALQNSVAQEDDLSDSELESMMVSSGIFVGFDGSDIRDHSVSPSQEYKPNGNQSVSSESIIIPPNSVPGTSISTKIADQEVVLPNWAWRVALAWKISVALRKYPTSEEIKAMLVPKNKSNLAGKARLASVLAKKGIFLVGGAEQVILSFIKLLVPEAAKQQLQRAQGCEETKETIRVREDKAIEDTKGAEIAKEVQKSAEEFRTEVTPAPHDQQQNTREVKAIEDIKKAEIAKEVQKSEEEVLSEVIPHDQQQNARNFCLPPGVTIAWGPNNPIPFRLEEFRAADPLLPNPFADLAGYTLLNGIQQRWVEFEMAYTRPIYWVMIDSATLIDQQNPVDRYFGLDNCCEVFGCKGEDCRHPQHSGNPWTYADHCKEEARLRLQGFREHQPTQWFIAQRVVERNTAVRIELQANFLDSQINKLRATIGPHDDRKDEEARLQRALSNPIAARLFSEKQAADRQQDMNQVAAEREKLKRDRETREHMARVNAAEEAEEAANAADRMARAVNMELLANRLSHIAQQQANDAALLQETISRTATQEAGPVVDNPESRKWLIPSLEPFVALTSQQIREERLRNPSPHNRNWDGKNWEDAYTFKGAKLPIVNFQFIPAQKADLIPTFRNSTTEEGRRFRQRVSRFAGVFAQNEARRRENMQAAEAAKQETRESAPKRVSRYASVFAERAARRAENSQAAEATEQETRESASDSDDSEEQDNAYERRKAVRAAELLELRNRAEANYQATRAKWAVLIDVENKAEAAEQEAAHLAASKDSTQESDKSTEQTGNSDGITEPQTAETSEQEVSGGSNQQSDDNSSRYPLLCETADGSIIYQPKPRTIEVIIAKSVIEGLAEGYEEIDPVDEDGSSDKDVSNDGDKANGEDGPSNGNGSNHNDESQHPPASEVEDPSAIYDEQGFLIEGVVEDLAGVVIGDSGEESNNDRGSAGSNNESSEEAPKDGQYMVDESDDYEDFYGPISQGKEEIYRMMKLC